MITPRKLNVAGVLLFLATLIVYLPSLKAGFLLDDSLWLHWNPLLKDLKGLFQIWASPFSFEVYYPVALTNFWIEYRLWHLDPFGYHLTSVLLHIANALLLWILLTKLNVPGAFFASLIFALHPVQVEPVVWISQRKNLLSLFFYLLASLCFIRFYNLNSLSSFSRNQWRFYFFTLFLFLCSLLSKPTSCMFPIVALLLLWWQGRGIKRRDILLLAPLFLMSLVLTWDS